MRRYRTTVSLALALALLSPAIAGPRCTVGMADWQPRRALEDKLKAEGWQIRRIKTDDGCYKVHGRRGDGQRVRATFAPDTLMLLREKLHHDDD